MHYEESYKLSLLAILIFFVNGKTNKVQRMRKMLSSFESPKVAKARLPIPTKFGEWQRQGYFLNTDKL